MTEDKILFNGSREKHIEEDFKIDCSDFEYIPHILKETNRTIAIGDIHGDLNVAIKMLEVAKCIKEIFPKENANDQTFVTLIDTIGKERYFIWIGDTTQVVQVGDQVDRCRPVGNNNCIMPETTIKDESSDIKILKFYTDLDNLAKRSKGRLISLLGNHEIMNVQGNMNYVSLFNLLDVAKIDQSKKSISMDDALNASKKSNYKLVGGSSDIYVNLANVKIDKNIINDGFENRKKIFSNDIIDNENLRVNKFLACTRSSAIIIGTLLFVHGGIIKKLAESYHLDDLNNIVRKWLLGKLTDELSSKKILYNHQENIKQDTVTFNLKDRLYEILSSKRSMFWNRILGYLPADIDVGIDNEAVKSKCDEYLNPVFDIYNIGGIIIGHTPQMSEKYGINSACNKKIWRVDIGASNAFEYFRKEQNVPQRIQVLEITYKSDHSPIFKVLSI